MKAALKKVFTLLIAASLCGCAGGSQPNVTESDHLADSCSSSNISSSASSSGGESAASSDDPSSESSESGVSSSDTSSGSAGSASSSSAAQSGSSGVQSGSSSAQSSSSAVPEKPNTPESAAGLSPKVFPSELEEIPRGYYGAARRQGTLVDLNYSTYESFSYEDLKAARDHRAFCGFSMGSVTTWRTFEYCLDYFRYFAPSSGSFTQDGGYMDDIVKNSGHSRNDFFIIAITGTDDFAASAFQQQIRNMRNYDSFRYSDTEKDGNLTFRVKEGYSHNGTAAMEYAYNALRWLWNSNP